MDIAYPQKFKLVIGLGNPGRQYCLTRHNVGFLWLDEWLKDSAAFFSEQQKFSAEVASMQDVTFMKPQTFMNLSGIAARKWVSFYRVPLDQVLVVHDELDLPFAELRIKFGGGSAGHNGIKSIAEGLESNSFWRLRVGIGRPTNPNQSVPNFVLGALSSSESNELRQLARDFFDNHWNKVQSGQLEKVISLIHRNVPNLTKG
ncbi:MULTISPECIES: aminoacyl-tRNA hydrolase [Candidatus Ichthyocystis]|uniref:aminoacyl-tRNA hydrolase n=1 Tax=Candidatus Ichthyocystis TaxID=2929841 RepID=UPI000A8C4A34|nr:MULTISPECIES: aminoacyl-tRNA hydrolase [Ichthyocystis]